MKKISKTVLTTLSAVLFFCPTVVRAEDETITVTTDEDGNAVFHVTLSDGEEFDMNDLPVGATYQITEEAGDYTSSYGISDNNGMGMINSSSSFNTSKNQALSTSVERVDQGEDVEVTYTNKVMAYQNLTVTMNVEEGPQDYYFSVFAEFDDLEPNGAYNSPIGRIVADEEGHAEKEFTIKHGDTVTFSNLPVGATYRLTERESPYAPSYTVTDSSGLNSIVKAENSIETRDTQLSTEVETIDLGENVTVTFGNVRILTVFNLSVSKTTTGVSADPRKEFTFNVSFSGLEANEAYTFGIIRLAGGAQDGAATEAQITADAQGNASYTFDLSDGEEINITGVPENSTVVVNENAYQYYEPSVNGNSGGSVTFTMDSNKTASFTNTNNTVYNLPKAGGPGFGDLAVMSWMGIASLFIVSLKLTSSK